MIGYDKFLDTPFDIEITSGREVEKYLNIADLIIDKLSLCTYIRTRFYNGKTTEAQEALLDAVEAGKSSLPEFFNLADPLGKSTCSKEIASKIYNLIKRDYHV